MFFVYFLFSILMKLHENQPFIVKFWRKILVRPQKLKSFSRHFVNLLCMARKNIGNNLFKSDF